MSNIKVNIGFRKTYRKWKDTKDREEHIINRMIVRGIGHEHIKEAIKKGSKRMRKDGSIITEFRWFKVIYREFRLEGIRKIYPITVFEV